MKRSIQYEIKLFLGVILFMAILSVLVGCEELTTPLTKSSVVAEVINGSSIDKIIKIRNCEYIKTNVHTGPYYVYTHCGDCTNTKHNN
jgi:hypothetical protein